MHTDEYEISNGREITLCQNMIKLLERKLEVRAEKCGMTRDALSSAMEQGRLPHDSISREWQMELKELQIWRRRLREYEQALQSVKEI